MGAFIELHDGIIANLNTIDFLMPTSPIPASIDGKKWSIISNGKDVQITDEEYNIIKNYYKTMQELY